jgi:ABC-type transport system substrate-binding protein
MLRLLVLLALIGLAGCGGSVREDQRLVLALADEPASLDPAKSKDVASGRLCGYIYSTLVRFDENLRIAGDLSDTFAVSPDGLTYSFHLRPDAVFATGRAVTAADVKWSFERVLNKKTASSRTWVLDRIEGAKDYMDGKAHQVSGIVASGSSVTIKLAAPFAPFLGFLTMPAASVIDPKAVEKHQLDFPRHESGSGPWTVLRWVKDDGLELVPNPRLKEAITQVTELRLGNVDLAEVPASELTTIREDPRWKGCIVDKPGMNVYYIGLNCEKGPFRNPQLRRAAALAVDRDRIVAMVREGVAVSAKGPIPPGLMGYDASFPGIKPDLAAARELVKQHLPPGTVIRLMQAENKENLEVTQMVQAFLEQAGFTVTLSLYESSTFKKRVDVGDFDAYFLNWFADYADAENFLFPLFHSSRKAGGGNGPRYSDPAVDALLEQIQSTADDTARIAMIRKAEAKVVDDASRIYLFHKKQLWLRQPWVRDFTVFPVFNSNTMQKTSLDVDRIGRF